MHTEESRGVFQEVSTSLSISLALLPYLRSREYNTHFTGLVRIECEDRGCKWVVSVTISGTLLVDKGQAERTSSSPCFVVSLFQSFWGWRVTFENM